MYFSFNLKAYNLLLQPFSLLLSLLNLHKLIQSRIVEGEFAVENVNGLKSHFDFLQSHI